MFSFVYPRTMRDWLIPLVIDGFLRLSVVATGSSLPMQSGILIDTHPVSRGRESRNSRNRGGNGCREECALEAACALSASMPGVR